MASKLDAVCLALTAKWAALPTLSGVQVVDGPQVNSDASPEWLFVGYDADTMGDANEGAVAAQDWMAFQRTKEEDGNVICAVVVVSGDVSIPPLRARALAILSAAEDALRADNLLGGLVMKSHVSEVQFFPLVTSSGAKARLVFTVTYLAEI